MAKITTKISNDYCPQALFLYGTKQEDGQPHFGLFSWFGYCHMAEGFGVMACIGEEKQTKDLIRKNGVFSANLVSEPLLPLADYYGCTYGRTTPDKMKRMPTVEWGQVLDVPTIAESPVSFELEVKKEIPMGDGSDIFLCLIRNVMKDEKLLDMAVPFTERLMQAAPVLAPGENTYSSIDGRYLGKWGEPMQNLADAKEI
ncbi:MAG: flavin reductase family protein [Clostridium sp.]|nr:flavin reductase family protein [Clostridium sp.]